MAFSRTPAQTRTATAADDRTVDVWRIDLQPPAVVLTAVERLLADDELERADRFRFERDRRRFVAARAALRLLLGGLLAVDAREIVFAYGPHGKPALAARFAGACTFNVSHSDELALVAISRDAALGVDVEHMRPLPDADAIAVHAFSPREIAGLRALPADDRHAAFFACWTRKVAYLKALGSGLAKPLDAFDVTFAPGDVARLSVPGDDLETDRWSMHALDPAPAYAGALVVERRGGERVVRSRRWSWEPAAVNEMATARRRAMEAI